MPLIHVNNPESSTSFKRRYMKIFNLGEQLPPAEKLLTQERAGFNRPAVIVFLEKRADIERGEV